MSSKKKHISEQSVRTSVKHAEVLRDADSPPVVAASVNEPRHARVRFDDGGNPIDPVPPSVNKAVHQARMNLLENLSAVYDSVLKQATVREVDWRCAACHEDNVVRLPFGSLDAAKIALQHVEKMMEMFKDQGGLGLGNVEQIAKTLSVEQLKCLLDLLER